VLNPSKTTLITTILASSLAVSVWGQTRIQFPTPGSVDNSFAPGVGAQIVAPPLSTNPPVLNANPGAANVTPVLPQGVVVNPNGTAGVTLQQPTFDAFSTQPNAANTQPSLFGTQPPATTQSFPGFPPPPNQPAIVGQPSGAAQPLSQFPGGLFSGNSNIATALPGPYLKAIDDLRFRYTWIGGDTGREMDINDVDVAVTFNWPNFMHSGQPLRISPGFSFHFWDGPGPPFSPAFEMPSKAYSTYVDLNWTTNLQRRVGGEANFTIGLYTDFQTLTSNSLRYQGTGLGFYRLTEYLTIKGGVTYLDRNQLKLLPAGGLFWYPTEDVRFEIYFPRPKLAQRVTTLGNTDIWVYLAGEYGGGSWTIERTPVVLSDQVDINDIRLMGGIEWLSGYVGVTGFFEVGWVTEREIVWKSTLPGTLKLEQSFMLRGGLSF